MSQKKLETVFDSTAETWKVDPQDTKYQVTGLDRHDRVLKVLDLLNKEVSVALEGVSYSLPCLCGVSVRVL